MTLLSKIADGYESGVFEWVQGSYGDTKQDMENNPERTPRFCPVQAVATLSDTRYDRIVAQRSLLEAVCELGYSKYQTYNDVEGRTLDEVLDTLRAADRHLTSHPNQVVHPPLHTPAGYGVCTD